jgi:uncharacterized protein YcfJ
MTIEIDAGIDRMQAVGRRGDIFRDNGICDGVEGVVPMSTGIRTTWVAVCLLAGTCGCRQFGNTEAGALVGTGLGATTGAIIGSGSGRPGAGALIGAATGAVAGGLVGNAADAREERDAAVAQAQYAQAQAHAAQQALTTSDVVSMSQSGVSDDVIVNAVQTRGCRFSGDPQSIIHLKQAGVSDRVIQAMQSSGVHVPHPVPTAAPPVVYTPAPVYAPPPPVVIVGPRPYPYYGPRRYWGPPPYHRHRW